MYPLFAAVACLERHGDGRGTFRYSTHMPVYQLGGHDAISAETTRRNFSHLLETHQWLCSHFPGNVYFSSKRLRLRGGTIGDATLIAVPRSTKKRCGQPMRRCIQQSKGNQTYFAIQVHSRVDDASGLVSRVHCTPVHVADVTQLDRLLDREDDKVGGDSGSTGADKRQERHPIRVSFLIVRHHVNFPVMQTNQMSIRGALVSRCVGSCTTPRVVWSARVVSEHPPMRCGSDHSAVCKTMRIAPAFVQGSV